MLNAQSSNFQFHNLECVKRNFLKSFFFLFYSLRFNIYNNSLQNSLQKFFIESNEIKFFILFLIILRFLKESDIYIFIYSQKRLFIFISIIFLSLHFYFHFHFHMTILLKVLRVYNVFY